METDDEIKGQNNHLDFGNRCYDSRVGRFLSTDKYQSEFAHFSPYIFAGNSPLFAIDNKGDSLRIYSYSEENVNKVVGAIQQKLGNEYTVEIKKVEINNQTIGDTNNDGFPRETQNTYYLVSVSGPENSTNSTFELVSKYANSSEDDLNVILDAKYLSRGSEPEFPLQHGFVGLDKITRYMRGDIDTPQEPKLKGFDRYGTYFNVELADYIAGKSSLELIDFVLGLMAPSSETDSKIQKIAQWKNLDHYVFIRLKNGDQVERNNYVVKQKTPWSVKRKRKKAARKARKARKSAKNKSKTGVDVGDVEQDLNPKE